MDLRQLHRWSLQVFSLGLEGVDETELTYLLSYCFSFFELTLIEFGFPCFAKGVFVWRGCGCGGFGLQLCFVDQVPALGQAQQPEEEPAWLDQELRALTPWPIAWLPKQTWCPCQLLRKQFSVLMLLRLQKEELLQVFPSKIQACGKSR